MTTLANFVNREVPLEFRQGRDFTGPRGWVWLANRFLRRMEREGLFSFSMRKESPVEVSDNYWITIPSDLRSVEEIYHPPIDSNTQRKITYGHEMVNGKIKLSRPFDKDASPDTFTLSEGGTSSTKINDADAAADLWNDYALVLTNGTYSGEAILISDSAAASGGTALLTFRHIRSSVADSTAGYLTRQYLMLIYMATYAGMSAHTDEIPIDDRFEDLLGPYLCYQAISAGDKRRRELRADFELELEQAKAEHFTPTPDQARPRGRSMPGFESCEGYGEENYEDLYEQES